MYKAYNFLTITHFCIILFASQNTVFSWGGVRLFNWREETVESSKVQYLRACLHGGGGPQIGEVTCGGSLHLSYKRDQTKMRDYMDRRVIPPKRVTSPTWGPPPPCKLALSFDSLYPYQ